MTADQYLLGILAREQVDTSLSSPVWAARRALTPVLSQWGGRFVLQVDPSGSFAKGTANRSGTDIDLFISLSPDTPETLKQIYELLFAAVSKAGYSARRQDVSIGLRVNGTDVDLVGFYPASTDTSDKPHNEAGGVSWRIERSTAKSSSGKLLG